MHSKFSKEDFAELDLPDLLINIWSYAIYQDKIIKTYCQWCVECAYWKVVRKLSRFLVCNSKFAAKQQKVL